jgi:hypothetical protein
LPEVTVTLNDEITIPDGVETALASGTPGDSLSVRGDVTVRIPSERDRNAISTERVSLEVILPHTDERTTQPISRTGEVTTDVFWVLEDDETLWVTDTARVQIRLLAGDSVLANQTTTATVENATRSYDC